MVLCSRTVFRGDLLELILMASVDVDLERTAVETDEVVTEICCCFLFEKVPVFRSRNWASQNHLDIGHNLH